MLFKVEVPRFTNLEDRDRFGQVEEVFICVVKVDGDALINDIIGLVTRQFEVMVFDIEFFKLIACAALGCRGLFAVGDDENLSFVIEGVCQQDEEVRAVGNAVVQVDTDFKRQC
jgi:hypothetical protein